jgi:hypothetical protein
LALLVLAVEVVILSRQNRELKQIPNRTIEPIKAGDYFSIDKIESIQPGFSLEPSSKYLLFLFTTTCRFCKENLKMWRQIFEKAKTEDISIIGISLHSQEKTKMYINENGVNFPVFYVRNAEEFNKINKLTGGSFNHNSGCNRSCRKSLAWTFI